MWGGIRGRNRNLKPRGDCPLVYLLIFLCGKDHLFFPSGTMLSHSSLYMSAEWGDGQMSNTSFMNGSK